MTVAVVTGATGAVGPAVVEALVAEGSDVRVFGRHPFGDAHGGRVRSMTGDLADISALAAAVAHADVVHHLGGMAHVSGREPEVRDAYARVNVIGSRNVARAAAEAGVARVVFYSTIAVYGPTDPNEIRDEASPLHPVGPYAESKAEAEESLRSELGSHLVVLRLAAVLGPRVKGNYRTLAHAIARGRFVAIGRLRNRRTVVCDLDVARAAVIAGRVPRAAGRTFNVTDGTVHTLAEIVDEIARASGRARSQVRVPLGPFRAAATAASALRALGLPVPDAAALLDKLVEDVAVSGDLIQHELGYAPAWPLRRCVERMLGG